MGGERVKLLRKPVAAAEFLKGFDLPARLD
jgi:hypothetical protein